MKAAAVRQREKKPIDVFAMFPEVQQIRDEKLRRAVVEIWEELWEMSDWVDIAKVPTSPEIPYPTLPHNQCVMQMALAVNMGFGIRKRTTTPLISARQLQELGVAVVIYPRLLTAAAIQGMKHALGALGESLKTGEVVERPDLLVSFEELNTLVGFDEVQAIEKKFLTKDQYDRKYRPAAE